MTTAALQSIDQAINGVNVTRMGATITHIKEDSALAKFRFRAKNRWVYGGHNQTTTHGFYGAGAEDTMRTDPFVLDADEPPVLLGEDKGLNPVEYVLTALISCMTTTTVYHAAAQDSRLKKSNRAWKVSWICKDFSDCVRIFVKAMKTSGFNSK